MEYLIAAVQVIVTSAITLIGIKINAKASTDAAIINSNARAAASEERFKCQMEEVKKRTGRNETSAFRTGGNK